MIERNEQLVTIFGGDGFIGRYVCEYLFKTGVRVRIASRDPRNSYFLQPLAQVGQFGFEQADITNRDSVRNAVKSATAVINPPSRAKMARDSSQALEIESCGIESLPVRRPLCGGPW